MLTDRSPDSIFATRAGVMVPLAHATVLYSLLLHTTLPSALVAGAIILIVIKHLGLLSGLSALFQHRARH